MSTDRWNPLRLLETLSFFGEIPFVGNVRWVQHMFGAPPNPPALMGKSLRPDRAVLLWGQDAAIADSLWSRVQSLGLKARSAQPTAESPTPDATAPPIVNTSVILWAGSDGDEGELARQVETLKTRSASEEVQIFDFQAANPEQLKEVWGAVDDVVMGGVSASGISVLPEFARFAGNVSTANSGGFASVRTRNFDPPFNFSGWQGVRLVVRGDGQRYKVILRNSLNWDSPAYCSSVDTVANQWVGVDVPFGAMQATFRARTQPTAPPLDPSRICSFQLMLSKFEYDGDKNPHFHPGPFALDVAAIAAYRPVSLPPLVAIAASPAQAAAYTDLLASSGLSHQVVDREDDQRLRELLTATGGTASS